MASCRKTQNTSSGRGQGAYWKQAAVPGKGLRSLEELQQEFARRTGRSQAADVNRKTPSPTAEEQELPAKAPASRGARTKRCYTREDLLAVLGALREADAVSEDSLRLKARRPKISAPPGLEDLPMKDKSMDDDTTTPSVGDATSDSSSTDGKDAAGCLEEDAQATGTLRVDAPVFEPQDANASASSAMPGVMSLDTALDQQYTEWWHPQAAAAEDASLSGLPAAAWQEYSCSEYEQQAWVDSLWSAPPALEQGCDVAGPFPDASLCSPEAWECSVKTDKAACVEAW